MCETLERESGGIDRNQCVILNATNERGTHNRHELQCECVGAQVLEGVIQSQRRETTNLFVYVNPGNIIAVDENIEDPLPYFFHAGIDFREVQPHGIVHLRVHLQFVLQRPLRGHRRLVHLHGEVIRLLVRAGDRVRRGEEADVVGILGDFSEGRVRLPGAGEAVGVVGEGSSPMLGSAAGNAAVVDEDNVVGCVVGGRVYLDELDGGDEGGIGGEAVEAEIEGGGGVGKGGEEVGVGAIGSGGLGPGGAPAEEDGGGEGDVEGGRARLGVVVVVDGEGAEKVARGGGEGGEGVAVFLAVGGGKEEAEGFLGGEGEVERVGDEGGGAGGEETVGKPCGVEGVSGVGRSATVNVVG